MAARRAKSTRAAAASTAASVPVAPPHGAGAELMRWRGAQLHWLRRRAEPWWRPLRRWAIIAVSTAALSSGGEHSGGEHCCVSDGQAAGKARRAAQT
eukprot:6759181-Prymnesium_polylepis.1